MKNLRVFIKILWLALMPCWVFAQAPGSGIDAERQSALAESPSNAMGGINLVLDNSRTKVGKDFYDLFYKHWSALPTQADSTQQEGPGPIVTTGDVVLVIEEIPTPGSTNAHQMQVSIDDQLVWQQFVQARYELLEEATLTAVDAAREYLASYQELQRLLASQGQ